MSVFKLARSPRLAAVSLLCCSCVFVVVVAVMHPAFRGLGGPGAPGAGVIRDRVPLPPSLPSSSGGLALRTTQGALEGGAGAADGAEGLPKTCQGKEVVLPSWPKGFDSNISAVFIVGEQKCGSTWLWELLDAHPCLVSPLRPHPHTGAITRKETYYFTSLNLPSDARLFLWPWLRSHSANWTQIGPGWLQDAAAARSAAPSSQAFMRARNYVRPGHHLPMQACKKLYLLEATPHNLHTSIAAARLKRLFPHARVLAIVKEPAARMRSAYNQFGSVFKQSCRPRSPAAWCPVFRYYQLTLPTFDAAVKQELEYLKTIGCTFRDPAAQKRTWMECFGCEVMDPWRHKERGEHIKLPPYAPSAALSMYAPMLRDYFKWFPPPRMQVVNREDLIGDSLAVVNGVLRWLGLEEYNQTHMDILNPPALGFKGVYPGGQALSAAEQEAFTAVHEFFTPLNQQLSHLLAEHNVSWSGFNV